MISNIDKNFYDTLCILNNLKLKYYCVCGTMLGLFRDRDLIAWDTDVDIAIFASPQEYRSLIDAMKDLGFTGGFNRKIRPGLPVLKFYRTGGRKIEFSTPIKNFKNQYCLEWYKCESPSTYKNLKYYQKLVNKFLLFIGRIPFQETQVGLRPCLYVNTTKKKLFCLILRFLFPFTISFNNWLRQLSKLDDLMGYYSKHLDPKMVTIIKYHGVDCFIPANSKDACIDFYGEDWNQTKGMDHYSDFYKDSLNQNFLKTE